MSLYDDIEPTIRRTHGSDDATYSGNERKYDNSKFGGGTGMLAPVSLITKRSTGSDTKPTHSTPSILQSIPVPQFQNPLNSNQTTPQSTPAIDIETLKNQIKAKRIELEQRPLGAKQGLFKNVPTPAAPLSAQNAYPPPLQARKVDVNKVKEINVVPTDILRDESEYLFDEVHIIDEYNPLKPNDYNEFMKNIGCNAVFGEEIDDSKLERFIIDEIINAKNEKRQRTPSPEFEERKVTAGPAIIANIMAKMGYTEGSGLGKHGQGMSSALRVEKKAGVGGRIVSEIDEVMMSVGLNPDEFTKPVTNVLLLRNMYTNEDIPDDYDQELKPELSQYGIIRRLYLHHRSEMEDPLEQVRIFVEYTNKANAVRAYADLNQRYFSERPIKADFYPTERFALGQFNDVL